MPHVSQRAAFPEPVEALSLARMKTLLGLVMIALAPLSGLLSAVLWLTAENRTINDVTVALVFLFSGLTLGLAGTALLIQARHGSEG
jgi:hypothetical protein